jgi:hypothetical protein
MPMRTATSIVLAGLLCLPVAAQTVGETAEQVGKSAENIVTKPLKDANILKAEIPPKLQAIMNDPYSLKGLSTCAQFSAEIAQLTKMLGPDVDAVKPKGGDSASEMVLGQIEKTASGLIPGSSIIRKVSGAEEQANKAKAAVYAGSLRRAYLKGAAKAKGCKI